MNVLFVCTGNTCRSPMAEAYLDSKNIDNLCVKSKGISADGSPVSENSVKAMADIGIDISGLVSEQLNTTDLIWADKIVCLSLSHKTVLKMYVSEEKITVLAGGISDPFGGDLEIYTKCRDEIVNAIDSLLEEGFFNEISVMAMEREHISQVAEIEKICFSEPWSEETVLDAFEKGTKFFVTTLGSLVVGYVGISCIIDEGYITNIAVLPEYRNRGIATALLNRLFSLASDLDLSFISLEVRESNHNAISLYEKMEFKNEGLRKNFYSNPKENALIMTKRF